MSFLSVIDVYVFGVWQIVSHHTGLPVSGYKVSSTSDGHLVCNLSTWFMSLFVLSIDKREVSVGVCLLSDYYLINTGLCLVDSSQISCRYSIIGQVSTC